MVFLFIILNEKDQMNLFKALFHYLKQKFRPWERTFLKEFRLSEEDTLNRVSEKDTLNTDRIIHLLDRGANPNPSKLLKIQIRTEEEPTAETPIKELILNRPLAVAIYHSNRRVTEALLQSGASISFDHEDIWEAATSSADREFFSLLVRTGITREKRRREGSPKEAFDVEKALEKAIQINHSDSINYLWESGLLDKKTILKKLLSSETITKELSQHFDHKYKAISETLRPSEMISTPETLLSSEIITPKSFQYFCHKYWYFIEPMLTSDFLKELHPAKKQLRELMHFVIDIASQKSPVHHSEIFNHLLKFSDETLEMNMGDFLIAEIAKEKPNNALLKALLLPQVSSDGTEKLPYHLPLEDLKGAYKALLNNDSLSNERCSSIAVMLLNRGCDPRTIAPKTEILRHSLCFHHNEVATSFLLAYMEKANDPAQYHRKDLRKELVSLYPDTPLEQHKQLISTIIAKAKDIDHRKLLYSATERKKTNPSLNREETSPLSARNAAPSIEETILNSLNAEKLFPLNYKKYRTALQEIAPDHAPDAHLLCYVIDKPKTSETDKVNILSRLFNYGLLPNGLGKTTQEVRATPLYTAISNKLSKVAEVLLAHPKIDPNETSINNQAFNHPLACALDLLSYETKDALSLVSISQQLIKHPKININAGDPTSPLQVITSFLGIKRKIEPKIIADYEKTILMLLDHPRLLLDKQDHLGNSFLHYVCLANGTISKDFIHNAIKMLAAKGAQLDLRNQEGHTPYDLLFTRSTAIRELQTECALSLFKEGFVPPLSATNPEYLTQALAKSSHAAALLIAYEAAATNTPIPVIIGRLNEPSPYDKKKLNQAVEKAHTLLKEQPFFQYLEALLPLTSELPSPRERALTANALIEANYPKHTVSLYVEAHLAPQEQEAGLSEPYKKFVSLLQKFSEQTKNDFLNAFGSPPSPNQESPINSIKSNLSWPAIVQASKKGTYLGAAKLDL